MRDVHVHTFSTCDTCIDQPHLKVLDIGFNKLTSLEGMKVRVCVCMCVCAVNLSKARLGRKRCPDTRYAVSSQSLPKLRKLNVSCNGLTCFFTDIGVLRRHTPALSSLDSQHNPWDKV